MTLLPIPEEELAKLVLGYLANEQLLTVYDEFLSASPYLDAAQNEYSFLFMKSLQSIVSEYWAAKIYVEKCKPFSLRKKLTKCSDLLDVVKFLITHVDHKKIASLNCSNDKTSSFTQTQNSTIKRYCQTCGSLREMCGCRERGCEGADSSDVTPAGLETTALTDLAGNSTAKVKRKYIKVLEKDSKEAARLLGYDVPEERGRQSQVDPSIQNASHSNNMTQPVDVTDSQAKSSIRPSMTQSLFSTTVENDPDDITSKTTKLGNEDIPSSGKGCANVKNTALADSTESDNTASMPTATHLQPTRFIPSARKKSQNTQYLIQVTGSKNLEIVPHTHHRADEAKAARGDDKVTILSDVKVNAKAKCKDAMVTSTPLLKVHQIVLTGKGEVKKSFTKEEIMAMPTCFVVSSSTGPLPVRSYTDTKPATSVSVTQSTSVVPSLAPLTIDITSSPTIDKDTKDTVHKVSDKIASVPKESLLVIGKPNTPHALPPTRKSSSTPRRSSHIRVLDFSTPRRILQEIGEVPMHDDEIVSRSPNLHIDETPRDGDGCERDNAPKSLPKPSKSGWDADLRALIANTEQTQTQTKRKRKPPPKQPSTSTAEPKTVKKVQKKPPKPKKDKAKATTSGVKPAEVAAPVKDAAEVTVKPMINIIVDWNEKADKSNNNEPADTPELERISLQHEIGAKLNISDLLETPFKQALYDIQMDTPKFLRPDIPDEPISEIKISDIPTPRFFEAMNLGLTPKPQTPAYASRNTDYSSGGSYYKPDDDYALPPQDIRYPDMTKVDKSKTSEDNSDKSSGSSSRPLRPVRKCTRNVSYRTKKKSVDLDTSGASAAIESNDEDTKENAKSDNKLLSDKRKSSSKPKKSPLKKATPKSFMKIKPRRPTPKRKSTQRKSTSRDKPADVVPAPTKSRRKSATPRKLHSKVFGSESPEHSSESTEAKPAAIATGSAPDTDSEPPLRWSDDCSHETTKEQADPSNEVEDIGKIQQYIQSTEPAKNTIEDTGQLHKDLVKRGFDIETAKSIERDLLDLSPANTAVVTNVIVAQAELETVVAQSAPLSITVADKVSDANSTNKDDEQEDDEEEVELSVCECDDDQVIQYVFDERETQTTTAHTLKDNYTMEFCLDEDFSVTLKTSAYRSFLDCEPEVIVDKETVLETEAAVESIMRFDSLYTPMKRAVKAQCKEIFDSTLTSIDTPLKPDSPKVTEIVLEVEPGSEEVKGRANKRRRRIQSGSCSDESATDTKKPKTDTRYLTNIQNIDIETVLSKLHGP